MQNQPTDDVSTPITKGTKRAEARRRINEAVATVGKLRPEPGDRPEFAFGLPAFGGVTVANVEVDRARAWRGLSFHGTNREIKASEVHARVDDILLGHFQVTNDLLTFSRTGKGLNGQKRLLAIWLTDVRVTMPVMFGAPDDAVYAMDRPERRDLAGDLRISGRWPDMTREARKDVQAAARVLERLAEGAFPWARSGTPYFYEASRLFEDHPFVVPVVERYGPELRKSGMPVGPIGALLGLFREANNDLALSYVERLFRVGTLPADDPVHHVVRFAQDHRNRMNLLKNKRELMIRCVRAWDNVWHGRKASKQVTHLADGRFPRIAGLRYDRDTDGLMPLRRLVAVPIGRREEAA